MEKIETLEDVQKYLGNNPMTAKVSYCLLSQVIEALINEIKVLKSEVSKLSKCLILKHK